MKKFEESIRKKLFGSEYAADKDLWQDIEKALPAEKPTGGFVWSQWPGILFILTAIIMIWETNSNDNAGSLQASVIENNQENQQSIDSAASSNAISSTSRLRKEVRPAKNNHKPINQASTSREEKPVISKSENEMLTLNTSEFEVKPAKRYYYNGIDYIQKRPGNLLQSEVKPAEVCTVDKQKVKAPEEIIPSPKQVARWALFMEGNPMLLYRQVTPNTNDDINITSLQGQNPLSLDRFGYQLRVGASYQLSHHWRVKAGFNYQYSRQKWQYHYQTRADSFRISQSNEDYIFEPVNNRNTVTVNQKDHFYGLAAGVNYLRGTRLIQNYNLELQGMLYEQQMKYFLAFDMNLEKPLNDYWSLYGGPALMWEFKNREVNTAPYNLLSYSIGLKLGVKYQFHFLRK